MECINRALGPQGRDTGPPRDVVCCLVSFPQKEGILRKAHNRGRLMHQGTEVKIYQDLSSVTLQRRKELRPLLDLQIRQLLMEIRILPFCKQPRLHSKPEGS